MVFRFVLTLAAVGLISAAAAAGQSAQAAPKPPSNEDCLACHGDADAKRADGRTIAVDAKRFEGSTHGPMACVDCHADLAKIAEFPHADTLARVTCASCHDDIGAKYHDSIHAWAKEKAGLTTAAPACADCHGRHDIAKKSEAASRVARANIPTTCGSCHAGIKQQYDAGIHAAALKKGQSNAPDCSDCHTAHTIQRADTTAWRLSLTAECGSCHAGVVESFTRTFHGKVNQLGSTRVAACSDCHGAHDILPASNPLSTISPAHLVATCGKCHAGANERFVQYDPHPDPRNYTRGATLWWANRFYWALIPGCFGFFGLHSLLWFWRSRRERARSTDKEGGR
jgi:nitrate/TMAO reductase-like tetraheme cytochrome c subunit